MKVDKRNPLHWVRLALTGLNVLVAIVLRPFRRRGGRRKVLFYGHRLSGNLLPIYRALRADPGCDAAFLTMDPDYHRALCSAGEASILATSFRAIGWLARADALVSDHGLHALEPMLRLSDLKFFDAWHGIPFKGFDADDFRVQHRYDETWVSSPLLAKMYVDRFGFAPEQVAVTGYARTDRLVRRSDDVAALRRRLGVPIDGPCVLFAPTWKQDAQQRSLYPFGIPAEEFLAAMSAMCERHDATMVVRSHLNSGTARPPTFPRIVHVPYAREPDTEGILLMSDILVCDWSSIAFDYLLLDRPTVFLDVEAPFAKGFSLGPEYRFGQVVGDGDELLATLERYLADDAAYRNDVGDRPAQVRGAVYGAYVDGDATQRCVTRLRAALG